MAHDYTLRLLMEREDKLKKELYKLTCLAERVEYKRIRQISCELKDLEIAITEVKDTHTR